MAAKKPVFTPPKNLAACADQLYQTREHRLGLVKEVEELERQESALREHLINNLPKSNATGIAGKLVRVSVENKTVYQVGNWDLMRAYITKNQKKDPGVWALMNKALNQATVREIFEQSKILVPGVNSLEVPVVRMNKL